jgi:hypothetical protein
MDIRGISMIDIHGYPCIYHGVDIHGISMDMHGYPRDIDQDGKYMGYTWKIPCIYMKSGFQMDTFSGAPGDRRMGAGDGCKMWFVNLWALGWSRDM